MEVKRYKATVTLTVTYPAYEHNARYDAHAIKDFAVEGVCEYYVNENVSKTSGDVFVTGTVRYEELEAN